MWLATIGLPMKLYAMQRQEMDYQDYLLYGYPYQFARGPGAVPYAMSSSQITPLIDLTANRFGPCISSQSSVGGAGRSSAGVGIAVNITPPGSVEVS